MNAIAAFVSAAAGLVLGLPGWALALVVGIGGAANAWAFYVAGFGTTPIIVELAVVVALAAFAGYGVGRLPGNPVLAVRAMDGLGIVVVVVGALGVFVGVWIAIAFTLPKDPAPSTELSETTKAISAVGRDAQGARVFRRHE
jgi:hypothetical protein